MTFLAQETTRKIWFWLLLVLAFFGFLYLIRGILLPFVVGIGMAYFLDPAADKLEKAGLSRTGATTAITIFFFSVIALATILLLPMLLHQLGGLAEQLLNYAQDFRVTAQTYLNKLPLDLNGKSAEHWQQLSGSVLKGVQTFALGMLQSGLVLVNLASLLVITPVVAFYLLRDWDELTARIDTLLPRKHAEVIRQQLQEIDQTLAGFVRGQFNVMLILGIYYAVALTAVGLPFGALIGLAAGLLIIIPYLGVFIGGALAIGVAVVQFDEIWRIALVGGIFVLGQMVEGYYLTPKLVGSRVGLHPVWVIFGMLAGGALFGFVGILLAVPVSAVIGVLVRFAVQRYLESGLYREIK